jgi:hypothetical protein
MLLCGRPIREVESRGIEGVKTQCNQQTVQGAPKALPIVWHAGDDFNLSFAKVNSGSRGARLWPGGLVGYWDAGTLTADGPDSSFRALQFAVEAK